MWPPLVEVNRRVGEHNVQGFMFVLVVSFGKAITADRIFGLKNHSRCSFFFDKISKIPKILSCSTIIRVCRLRFEKKSERKENADFKIECTRKMFISFGLFCHFVSCTFSNYSSCLRWNRLVRWIDAVSTSTAVCSFVFKQVPSYVCRPIFFVDLIVESILHRANVR